MKPYSIRRRLRSAMLGTAGRRAAKPKSMILSEGEAHSGIIEYLEIALPAAAVFHHSPNEGKRGRRAQRDIKALGTRAGWPDIEIVHEGRIYFLEVKRVGEKPTEVQEEVHTKLRAAGAGVEVCYSIDDVRRILEGWGFVLRARLA